MEQEQDHGGVVTIPAKELRALQSQLEALQRANNELQMFLVLEMREKGRARYTASEIAQVCASRWDIDPKRDADTQTIVLSVREHPRAQPPQVVHTAPRANVASGALRIVK